MPWFLTNAANFSQHAAEWDQLNNTTYQSPILEARFIAPLLSIFGSGAELLCQYHEKDTILAQGIICKNSFGNWCSFQPSQAPIGLWVSHSNYDLPELLPSLARELPGPCLLFSLLQLDSELTPRPTPNNRLAPLDYIQTARIQTDIGFEAYSQNRSKNLRKNLRKQHNKLAEKSLETELKVITDSTQVEAAIKAYGELESAGWKAETNTAITPDNAQGCYYTQILKSFCESGDGLIYQYLIGNEVAAMDLCVANQDTIVILKTTYNEAFKDYSPALLMHQEVFKHIFEQTDFKTIEFYGKVMDWHTKWSDECRDIYHLNFYRSSIFMKLHSPK